MPARSGREVVILGAAAHADREVRRIASRRPSRRTRRRGGARRACARGADARGHRRSPDRPRPPGRIGSEPRAAGRPPRRRSRPAPAQTINKACASACRRSRPARSRSCSANREVVLAGGIESMSRMPYLVDAADARWGHKMGNFTLVDAMYRDGFRARSRT